MSRARHQRPTSAGGIQQRLPVGLAALAIVVVIILGAQRGGLLPGRATGVAGDAPPPDPRQSAEQQLERVQATLRERPDDGKALGQLGQLYLQQARATGDPAYYPRAEVAFTRALGRDSGDVTAILGLGSLALSRHQFRDALAWGERARVLAPARPAVYGLIGDAQTELGQYPEAVATFQQMMDLKPDLNSYARVSYARELHGLMPDAIDAMLHAAEAGAPGQEGTAWTWVQLGNLYFATGALDAAQAQYERALRHVPQYLHAQAGIARVAAARGDYPAAIDLYRRATATLPIPEYVIALGDVYVAAGDRKSAEEQYALVRIQDRLLTANGVNTDLEFALFAADHPEAETDPGQTVERARAAFANRPGIYGHDVLAWALYRAGDYRAAREESTLALALGTQDAALFFHAGAIAWASGDPVAARGYFERALLINPHFSLLHAPEAQAAQAELAGR